MISFLIGGVCFVLEIDPLEPKASYLRNNGGLFAIAQIAVRGTVMRVVPTPACAPVKATGDPLIPFLSELKRYNSWLSPAAAIAASPRFA